MKRTMNIKRYFHLAALALISLTIVSCHKKDDPEFVSKPIEGNISLNIPSFAVFGETLENIISTQDLLAMLKHPGGTEDGIGLCFSIYPGMTFTDTIYHKTALKEIDKKNLTLILPDTLATVTLTLTAYPVDANYTSLTYTADITLVDTLMPSKSMTINNANANVGWPLSTDMRFTDPRDGKTYVTTMVAGAEWMKQNLAWEGSGKGYKGYDITSNALGRYYTWAEAQTACPTGWRLATENDWISLANAVTGKSYSNGETVYGIAADLLSRTYFNTLALWTYTKEVPVGENSLLSIPMLGYAQEDDSFKGIGDYAIFWEAEKDDNGLAYARYLTRGHNELLRGAYDSESFRTSVRCVRDAISDRLDQ